MILAHLLESWSVNIALRTQWTFHEDVQYEGGCLLAFPPWAIALMMEATSASETSVNYYQTAQCSNPKQSHVFLSAERTWNLIELQRVM
jgi:hypothetical protein